LVAKLAASPAATVAQLRDFTMGLRYLLGQVELLEDHLRSSSSFHPGQRVLAIHLCGRNPRDLLTDPVVKQWNLRYLSGLHGPGRITGDQAAQAFIRDVPDGVGPQEFARRLGEWLAELQDTATGRSLLRQSLAELRSNLQTRYQVVAEREDADQELAVKEAML